MDYKDNKVDKVGKVFSIPYIYTFSNTPIFKTLPFIYSYLLFKQNKMTQSYNQKIYDSYDVGDTLLITLNPLDNIQYHRFSAFYQNGILANNLEKMTLLGIIVDKPSYNNYIVLKIVSSNFDYNANYIVFHHEHNDIYSYIPREGVQNLTKL